MSTPASSRHLRDLLEARARQLRDEIAVKQRPGESEEHEVNDQKDTAGTRVLAEIGDAEVNRDLAELRQIASALERIDGGHYGQCSDCGKAIDPRRLVALPAATRCAACQGDEERRAAHTPHP